MRLHYCSTVIATTLFMVGCNGNTINDLPASLSSVAQNSSVSVSSETSSLLMSSSSIALSSSSDQSTSSISNSLPLFTVQESDMALCQYSGVVDTKHPGFSGAGFIDTLNEAGASIVFAVNVSSAGSYGVDIRYANGSTKARGGNLSAEQASSTTAFNLGITNAWDNWQTESGAIALAQGNNIVRLSATTANGLANIDSITVEGQGLSAGECGELQVEDGGSDVVIGDAPGDVYPPAGADNINPDISLRITFDSKPVINAGAVNIVDANTGARVDSINVGQEQDTIGERNLKTYLVSVVGNTVIINPHNNTLAYGKTYNIEIGSEVFSGQIEGQNYTGVSGTQWQFRTKPAGPTSANVTVDDDAPADFGSVQGALDYIMSKHGGNASAQINIKNGVYPELLHLKNKSNLRIVGESQANTIVRARNGNTINSGSSGRPLLLINGGDMVSLENFSIHNTATRGGGDGQAEAIYFNSGGRFVAKNMAFYSEQDTILTKGYAWFYNSLISGNVDFIWGYPNVALFENSEIRTVGDSKDPNGDSGGYVLQSRSPTNALGFVFLNSRFTRGKGPAGNTPGNGKATLGRGANKSDSYDSAAFINCQMDAHIRSEGFDSGRTLNPSQSTALAGYREYGSTTLSGSPINLGSRFSVYALNAGEVSQWYSSREKIFASYNNGQGWNPVP